jgi:hypothetical protein
MKFHFWSMKKKRGKENCTNKVDVKGPIAFAFKEGFQDLARGNENHHHQTDVMSSKVLKRDKSDDL